MHNGGPHWLVHPVHSARELFVIDADLLKILACPDNREPLAMADDGLLQKVNARIEAEECTGGEGLIGVFLAGYAAFVLGGKRIQGWPLPVPPWLGGVLALLAIAGILWLIAVFARRKPSDA